MSKWDRTLSILSFGYSKYFGKGLWILRMIRVHLKSVLLLNHSGEKCVCNLYPKICDVFCESLSQIVQMKWNSSLNEYVHYVAYLCLYPACRCSVKFENGQILNLIMCWLCQTEVCCWPNRFLKNTILNNNSSIRIPNDHGNCIVLIIIAEEWRCNE